MYPISITLIVLDKMVQYIKKRHAWNLSDLTQSIEYKINNTLKATTDLL
jgi:hypothetical protein